MSQGLSRKKVLWIVAGSVLAIIVLIPGTSYVKDRAPDLLAPFGIKIEREAGPSELEKDRRAAEIMFRALRDFIGLDPEQPVAEDPVPEFVERLDVDVETVGRFLEEGVPSYSCASGATYRHDCSATHYDLEGPEACRAAVFLASTEIYERLDPRERWRVTLRCSETMARVDGQVRGLVEVRQWTRWERDTVFAEEMIW